MPNWAFNTLTIAGDEKRLQELKDHVGVSDNQFDFNTIILMPRPLYDTESSLKTDQLLGFYCYLNNLDVPDDCPSTAVYDTYRDCKDQKKEAIEDANKLTQKELDYGKRAYDNLIEYGYIDWYKWAINNWGTKWNSDETTFEDEGDGKLHYYFNTAWCAPIPVIEELSRQFPDLVLSLEVSYEGGEPPDIFVFSAGDIKQFRRDDEVYVAPDGTVYTDWDDVPESLIDDVETQWRKIIEIVEEE